MILPGLLGKGDSEHINPSSTRPRGLREVQQLYLPLVHLTLRLDKVVPDGCTPTIAHTDSHSWKQNGERGTLSATASRS